MKKTILLPRYNFTNDILGIELSKIKEENNRNNWIQLILSTRIVYYV